MKKYNLISKNLLAALTLLLGVTLTSCVYDKDEEMPATSGSSSLVINIKPTSVGSTRAVTMQTDLTAIAADELKIQNMVVGVFRKDDTSHDGIVLALEEYTDINASASSGYSRLTNLENATNHYAEGDEVLVAINLPQSVRNILKDKEKVSTRQKFLGVFDGTNDIGVSIDQALTQKDNYDTPSENVIAASCLPMFGEATIVQAKKTDNTTDMKHNFTADISVIHMVSRITLKSVTFDITGNASANPSDQFTLQEAFLINVPTALDFSFKNGETFTTAAGTTFTGSYDFADFAQQYANQYQGWTSDYTVDATHLKDATDDKLAPAKAYRDYLGTGAMNGETPNITTGTQSNHSYVLYTMPNNNGTATTRLVIKAVYNGTTNYYPIELLNNTNGAVSTDAKIYPNRNYVVDVIIKGVGAGTPYSEVGVQQTTQSNVNVLEWTTTGSGGGDLDPTDWD